MAATTFTQFIFLTLVAGSLAVGCNRDQDGDGFKTGVGDGADCDDDDADIWPGADEYCDGVDNDCDMIVDEPDAVDASVWFGDGDGDGYGEDTSIESACSQPNGYVDEGGDCNDMDPALNPETFWYADADLDDYGDDEVFVQQCVEPDDYVADNTDCDDTAYDVNPGYEEQCDDIDHDCDGTAGLIDDDNDGMAECEGDCDDANPTTYPGADEYCDEVDNDCDDVIDEDDAVDATTWYLDSDFDGYGRDTIYQTQCEQPEFYVANADDCDDNAGTTYPGADEYCDGIDNDCDEDGAIDETPAVDAPTYYIDTDGDGYGTDDTTITDQCDMPTGYAEDLGDCDDADLDTYPGADEYCDGVDDDCDGLIDEAGAIDEQFWYEDVDNDGYGDPIVVVQACNQPSGYTAVGGDCETADSTINPAADEYCDWVDNDCDGSTDEPDALDAETWYADADADGYGDAASPQNACTVPSGYVDDDTDCDDADITINPAEDEICNDGVDNNCSGGPDACTMDVADADTILLGNASNDQGGRTVTTVSDWNADGIDDLLVSSRSGGSTAGINYLYYGATDIDTWGSLVMDTNAAGGADVTFTGGATGDYAAVVTAGSYDMDGDGAVDIAIGSASPDSERGRVWMMFGDYTSVPSGDLSLGDAGATWSGITSYDRAAGPNGLAYLGDFDGDGYNDMAVAANSADDNGSSSGTTYIVYGPVSSGDHSFSDVDNYIYGANANDRFGKALGTVGDMTGDGTRDLAVGTLYGGSYAGVVYVFQAGTSGAISADDADLKLDGEDLSDYAGTSVADAGDYNGDGYADLLVGATRDDTGASDGGAAYLVAGGSVSGDLGAVALAKFYGTHSSGNVGSSVAGTDDYDGAGTPAVMAGATSESSGAGAVYLFLGAMSGNVSTDNADAVFTGTDPADAAGAVVQFTGDLDGSGIPYLLTATYQSDLGGTDAGAAYLIGGLGE